MKDRGKAVETHKDNNYSDFNYSASDLPCKKHPSSSSVGICAQCLKDRLIKLVCSDCGEQRLSSCSCSEISSNPKLSNVDVGSVGRVSFLIENERTDQTHQSNNQKPRNGDRDRSEEIFLLKRSSSSCIEIKKGGFWKIGRLFRKKRSHLCDRIGGFDEKSGVWVFDNMGVSRSRSLCSFRGGGLNDQEEGSEFAFSSAKVSDFNGGLYGSEPRKSGARGSLDSENGVDVKCLKKGGTTDLDSALFGTNRSVFPIKESDFNAMDDSNFIDLHLDLSSESKTEYSAPKLSDLSESDHGFVVGSLGSLLGDGIFSNGGSCRITVNERENKRGSKGYKVWRWIFRHHQAGWRS